MQECPIRRSPLRESLRPVRIGQTILVALGLLFGLLIFGSPGSESGDFAQVSAARVAPAISSELNPDEQRDALRLLGGDLCGAESAAVAEERQDLEQRLGNSLGAVELERFWSRAVAGKTPAQIEGAFFGCQPLTDWMRERARAEGVDIDVIIATRAQQL